MGTDDPHFTSGVGNHFFYLLAEGTGPKTIGGRAHDSESCNSTSFSGIGRDNAAQIWYRALTTYMTSTSGYIDARDATIRAAIDVAPCGLHRGRAGLGRRVRAGGSLDLRRGRPAGRGCQRAGCQPRIRGRRPPAGRRTAMSTSPRASTTGSRTASSGTPVLNGHGRANTARLTRTAQVTVPDTATATLRFSLLVYSAENPGAEHDTLDVTVDGTPVGATGHWNNNYGNYTYRRWSVPMSAYAGQTVTIGFLGKENANRRYTGFLVDDVSLTPR